MSKQLSCVALIDDDEGDNYLHELVIAEAGCAERVVAFEKADEALRDLAVGNLTPDLIFLDINMPGMDGWEFLHAYDRLPETTRQAIVIMMLTTSLNPADREKARKEPALAGFCNKPLTVEKCQEVLREHFGARL